MLAIAPYLLAPFALAPQSIALEEAALVGSQQSAFGLGAVAVSGDTVLFQGTAAGGAGEVHVFVRGAGGWSEEAVLQAGIASAQDRFGISIALQGDRAVVGATDSPTGSFQDGAAFVFERSGGAWSETGMLTAGPGGQALGKSVALSGDTIVVGDPASSEVVSGVGPGAAHVYVLSGGAWVHQALLAPADLQPDDDFGSSVAVEGDVAVVGAHRDDHSGLLNVGSAYVFTRSGTSWVETRKLLPPVSANGDSFGIAVAVSGTRIAVGASHEQPPGGFLGQGAVHVYELLGSEWTWRARVVGSGLGPFSDFGREVALQGTTLVAGAPSSDTPLGPSAGSVHLFRPYGTDWVERLVLLPSGGGVADFFGDAVALDGATVAACAPLQDTVAQDFGATLVFALGDATRYCTSGTSAAGCQATMSAQGLPSATLPSGFELQVEGAPGLTQGLFLYGTGGRQAQPWGNGTSYQCVAPPVRRGAPQSNEGSANLCTAAIVEDLNARWCPSCPKPAHNPGPGATVQAQFWYRDPLSTSSQTTSLSDAIEFGVGP